METRRIGSLEVSTVALGCNNFGWHIDEAASREVIAAALDNGINHFDTADSYGPAQSEEILGRALKGRRDEVIIATKFGSKLDEKRQGAAPAYVKQAAEDSLRRLGTDRIDLLYLHKPDEQTPIADTLGALDELVKEGKVREIGCSNFSTAQLHEAHKAAGSGAKFSALQNEYSLLHREPEQGILQACRELGIAFIPYFPLKSGLLTGKYSSGTKPAGARLSGKEGSYFKAMGEALLTEENLQIVQRLTAFAESKDRSIVELAISWLLAQEAVVSVIAGATKAEQVRQNAAAGNWRLSADDLAAVDQALQG